MPWDDTTLYLAQVQPDGSLSNIQKVWVLVMFSVKSITDSCHPLPCVHGGNGTQCIQQASHCAMMRHVASPEQVVSLHSP